MNLKENIKNIGVVRTLLERKYLYIEKQRRKIVTSSRIEVLKNTKKNCRCFIVGNGPSLRIEDLNKIIHEDSFAVNRIYKIFNKTNWRPTYYVSQDSRVIEEIMDDAQEITSSIDHIFISASGGKKLKKIMEKNPNVSIFYLNKKPYTIELPEFSLEPNKEIYEGFTVAYACIQLAVYMGYSEIYIIGINHSYNINQKLDGTIEEDKNITNYMDGLQGKLAYPPQLEKSTLAFRKARRICDSLGIVIKNATRGGKLEEFERVHFDSLFEE